MLMSKTRAWLLCLLLMFFCVLQFVLQGIIGLFSEDLSQDLGLDAQSLSILSSSFYYSYVAMQIPAGIILDRFGLRRVVIVSMLAMLGTCLGFAYAGSWLPLLLSRILMGGACSFAFVAMILGIRSFFPIKQLALVVAWAECISTVGVGVANAGLSVVLSTYSWQGVMFACVGGGVILWLVTLCCLPGGAAPATDSNKQLSSSLLSLLKRREILVGGLFSACLMSVITVFVAMWAIPYLIKDYGFSHIEATMVSSMVYAGIAFSSPIWGYLLQHLRVLSLMSFGALCSIFFMAAVLYNNNSSPIFIGSLMFFLGFFASVYQFSFVLVGRAFPQSIQGKAVGLTNMLTMMVAPLLQPLLGFLLVDYSLSYSVALGVLPCLLFAAWVLSFLLSDCEGFTWREYLHFLRTVPGSRVRVRD